MSSYTPPNPYEYIIKSIIHRKENEVMNDIYRRLPNEYQLKSMNISEIKKKMKDTIKHTVYIGIDEHNKQILRKFVSELSGTSNSIQLTHDTLLFRVETYTSNNKKRGNILKNEYCLSVMKMMTEAIKQYKTQTRKEGFNFIQQYLSLAFMAQSLCKGDVNISKILNNNYDDNVVPLTMAVSKGDSTKLSKTQKELYEFLVEPSTLHELRELLSYNNIENYETMVEKTKKYISNNKNSNRVSNKFVTTYFLYNTCDMSKNPPDCVGPREEFKKFARVFLRYYLEYIQRVSEYTISVNLDMRKYTDALKTDRRVQPPKFRQPQMQRGGNYDFVSNTEWMSPSEITSSDALYLTRNRTSNDPRDVVPSSAPSNMTNIDVLLGLDDTTNRKAYRNHSNTKKITELLTSDAFMAKELIERRYTLQEQLDTLENNFYGTFNLQQLQDTVTAGTKTTQFQYKTENLKNAGSNSYNTATKQADDIYNQQMKSHPTKEAEYNKDAIIASLKSIRGWKYMDLTKHAIGSMNDVVILATKLIKTDIFTADDTSNIAFMKNILRPYIAKVYRTEPKNTNASSNDNKLNTALININTTTKPFYIKANTMVSESDGRNAAEYDIIRDDMARETVVATLNTTFTNMRTINPDLINSPQTQEFLIMVIYNLFETTAVWLEAMAKSTKDAKVEKAMKASISAFRLIYKSGIKNYFGIEKSTAKYAFDKGNRKPKAGLEPTSELIRIIGGLKNNPPKHLDRLQPESYPISISATGNRTTINSKETTKRLAKILESADANLHIGGPIQQPIIMKESVSMISKFVKSEIKAKRANVKRLDMILSKMKTRVHKRELIKMTRLLELAYRDIASERNNKMKKLQIDSALQSITTTYKSYKDSELNAIKSMLSFSKMYDEQYKELTSDRKTKLNYIKEREKVVIDLLYNQLRAKTYRNLATSFYKFLKNNSDINPSNNDTNYSRRLPESFYTLLEQSFNRIDESYATQLSSLLSQSTNNGRPVPSAPPANESNINRFFENVNKKYLKNIDRIITNNSPANVNVNNINREIENVNKEFRNAITKETATPVVPPLTRNGNSTRNRNSSKNRNLNRTKPNNSKDIELRPSESLSTLSSRISKSKQQEIASEKFWLNIRKKMKGKTVFVGYVEKKSLLKDEHGFFDLLESAIRGRIYKKFIVPGVYVNMKTLSEIYGTNYLMVTDTNRDKANPNMWQNLPMTVITTMAKLSQDDLRLYIYLLITSSANFNKRLSYMWPDTSVTKEKVLNYCRIIGGYEGCPILRSRYEISKMMFN